MSVSAIKATIQMRKGLESDFDADQMTAGEWAVSIDTKYVRMCFAPGIVIRMATYEAFEQDMLEIQTILATCQNIQTAVEAFEQLAGQHASQAETWSTVSKSWAVGGTGTRDGEDTNNSKYWSQQSKNEADRAKNEADRASSIAGIDIDSELSLTSTNPVQNKVVTNALNNIDVDISSDPVEFSEATTRANIESGETIPTVFGKIKKWYTDLKEVAFSGSYNDLIDSPDPTAVKGNEESEYRTGNVNLTSENIGAIPTSKIIQSTNITEPGFVMDGKTASEEFSWLSGKTKTQMATGATLETSGRQCSLVLSGATYKSSGAMGFFIPEKYRPDIVISAYVLCYVNGKFYPGLITTSQAGGFDFRSYTIEGSYGINPASATLYGVINWIA